MASQFPKAAAIDGVAISLSGLCVIHCLFLPVAIAYLPAIANVWSDSEWVHQTFVVAALPFALLALRSVRANVYVRALIVTGMVMLALGAFYEPVHEFETGLTVLGGALLAVGHAWRWARSHGASQS